MFFYISIWSALRHTPESGAEFTATPVSEGDAHETCSYYVHARVYMYMYIVCRDCECPTYVQYHRYEWFKDGKLDTSRKDRWLHLPGDTTSTYQCRAKNAHGAALSDVIPHLPQSQGTHFV